MRHAVWVPFVLMAIVLPAFAWAGKSREQVYVDAVLDGLVGAGVITRDQADQIKQDATEAAQAAEEPEKPAKPKWYDTTKVGGYAQGRWSFYPDAEGDDPDNEFTVRRARIKVEGKPTDRAKVELQLDMTESGATVKDAWLQYDIDREGALRGRLGQQKIPFGFETPQSSSQRIPLERNWVTRRVVEGERDTGLVVYWTDPADKDLFDYAKSNEWGTGDYGTVAVGVYNGQGINAPEVNDAKHVSARFAKPFMIGDRYAEAGASYYGGRFFSSGANMDLHEHLWGAHFYLPPHPVGIQTEFYTGRTEGDSVDGFYTMGLWRPCQEGVAFVRYDEYNGPRKGKGIGNVYDRERWSFGYAHQIDSKTEVTLEYDAQDTASGSDDLFGLQLQTGY